MEMDVEIGPAWTAFMEASEVRPTVQAYAMLRRACKVASGSGGRAAFDAVKEATAVSSVPHKLKSLMTALGENWKTRPTADAGARVVISGAGPVGLRAAVEAALNGMIVHVIEKRDIFSRVNILMLWQGTADDLVSYGAKSFYPKFTNRNMGNAPLHLGTREIQLVLLKNALLLGVTFSYGTELVALQPPPLSGASLDAAAGEAVDGSGWSAWALPPASKETHQTAGGVLDFKPSKEAAYAKGTGMGACNLVQASELDATFVPPAEVAPPAEAEVIPFDALLLAEGEWSSTCQRLGFTKNIDKFSQAIGLVINLVRDPNEPKTKDPNMRSFTVRPFDPVGRDLTAAGIGFEFAEYLKGETHYIVLTIKKAALLAKSALREDKPNAELLTKANLDEAALMVLAREIATIIGLPETTQFTDFHGAKLFDFSSRARCAAPFRVLGLGAGGARAGAVLAADLEVHPYLSVEEGKYFGRALELSKEAVAKCDTEIAELAEAIAQTSSNLSSLRSSLEAAADGMLDKVAAHVASKAASQELLRRQSTGIEDDEWEDEDALKPIASVSQEEIAAQRRAEYGMTSEEKLPSAEDVMIEEARLEAYERSMRELQTKRDVQQKQAEANATKQAEWAAKVAAVPPGSMSHTVPIFPIGDSLLEPFWPQGLGSNRGFHSALDAVWAVHLLAAEGLEASLLERNFFYDLMLLGPWQAGAGLLKGAETWRADPASRYADGAILRTKQNYTNPQSKRLFRGEGATPARIAAMNLKGGGFK